MLCKVTVAGSFAQDGGVCSSSTASTALCDGRLYSDVTKGCASYLSNINTWPPCGSKIYKHSEPNTELRIVNTTCGNSKNSVDNETLVLLLIMIKMNIFDIEGLDVKYSSSILIKFESVCSSSTASTALCDGSLYSDVTKGCALLVSLTCLTYILGLTVAVK